MEELKLKEVLSNVFFCICFFPIVLLCLFVCFISWTVLHFYEYKPLAFSTDPFSIVASNTLHLSLCKMYTCINAK